METIIGAVVLLTVVITTVVMLLRRNDNSTEYLKALREEQDSLSFKEDNLEASLNEMADRLTEEKSREVAQRTIQQKLQDPDAPVVNTMKKIETVTDRNDDGVPDKIIFLYLIAPRSFPFSGIELRSAMERLGLEYGPMDIFHFKNEANQRLFSIASLTEPGYFDLKSMNDASFKGLTIFMQLPAANNSVEVFEKMLDVGRQLSERLKGDLQDETRRTITKQSVTHIRNEIAEFDRKHKVAVARRLN